jgi:SNF2 family DNA or RNA helicase
MLPLFATRSNPLVDLHADERDPFVALMRSLYDDAPEALQAWLKANGTTVKDVAADAVIALRPRVPERTRATGGAMSLHDAIHWAHARAQELVGATVFEGDKMKDDAMGASMSTYPMLLAYTEEDSPDAIPLATHAIAIETLRTHAGKHGAAGGQLIRSEWESAYEAIRAAAEAEGEVMPEPESRPSLRSPRASPKSGLPDGSHYRFDPATGRITLNGSYSRTHKTALLPLVKQAEASGKIPQGSHKRTAPGTDDFTFTIPASAALGLAEQVQVVYPHLAAVLRQHAAYWQGKAGGGAQTSTGTGTGAGPRVVGDANAGGVPSERIEWSFAEADKQVHVRGDFLAKAMKEAVGSPSVFVRDANGYYFSCPVSEPKLRLMADEFDKMGKPITAEAIRAYIPTWLSVGRTAVDQSRERGDVPEENARWETRSSQTASGALRETIYLYLGYTPSMGLGGSGIKGIKREKTAQGWAIVMLAPKIPEAAQWLRENDLPRTGEALSRAFGGVKGVIDEEAEHCAVMTSMSMIHGTELRGAVNPSQVNDPKAQEAIEYVRSALRQRVVNPDLKPFPFQLVGMAFAKLSGYRTMIADAPGLGKTIQAIGTLIADPQMLLPAMIVAPKNVAGNWVKELAKWMPNTRVQLVGSRTILDLTAHVYVMGFETMRDNVEEWLPMGAGYIASLEKEIEEGIAAQKAAEAARAKGNKNVPDAPSDADLDELRAEMAKAQQIPEKNRIKYLIVDEAHKLKDPSAAWSKAGRAVAGVVPHALFLTGTPMMNKILELHALLSMLRPDTWGTLAAFKKQYAGKIEKIRTAQGTQIEKVEGVKDAAGLRTRMGCELIRRRKADAIGDLVSPKAREMVPVCVSEEDAAVYSKALREYEAYIRARMAELVRIDVDREIAKFLSDSGLQRDTLIAAGMDRILADEYGILTGHLDEKAIRRKGIPLDEVREQAEQEADARIDAALEAKGVTRDSIEARVEELSGEAAQRALKAEVLTQMGRLLEITGKAKVPAVVRLIKTIHAQKAPARVTDNKTVAPEGVVVFIKHKSVMDAYKKALREAGISFGTIEGSGKAASSEARVKLVEDFQNGKLDVVLAGEGGREGLTLTRAKYLIMAQRFWTPAAEQQAEDRIHRIGQKRDALILIPFIPTAGTGATIDDYMQTLISKKRTLNAEVLGEEEVEEDTLPEDEEESEAEATAGVLTAAGSIKALKGGELCVDPALTGSTVTSVQRHVADGATKALRENPRAFTPAAVPSRSEVQTVLFDRRAWSKAAAEAWLRHHGYDARKVDTTEHYHRFRQHDPHHYVPGSFRTISFTSSIKAVVGSRR